MEKVPNLKGRDGFEMPIFGLGTWQLTGDDCESAVNCALEAGYRLFDTAYAYMNEAPIGKVINEWIKAGKVKRQEIFITTKLNPVGIRPEHVEYFLDLSLKNLNLNYVDLYLVHVPFGIKYHGDENFFPYKDDGMIDFDPTTDIIAVWKKMEMMKKAGKARHIGVSNFSIDQVRRILDEARIPPVVNQVQLNAYMQQPDLIKYLQDHGIVPTSYSTLGTPGTQDFFAKTMSVFVDMPNILNNDVVKAVAREVKRSPAQVLLRHMIQKQVVVFPKSGTPSNIKENIRVFDFQLSLVQMALLDSLDREYCILDFRHLFKGIDAHPEYQLKHKN